MSQLDPTDVTTMRELVRVFEALARWRDLLNAQLRQAELETDKNTKVELYRAVGRRWLEQFTNVQNGLEAFEKLHQVDPTDREASDRLRELYTKRRAFPKLFELLQAEADAMLAGTSRRDLWMEMAKLAAERLDRGAEACKLYKRILEEEPGALVALDALEKQAERDKDFATVAEVLERRVELAKDNASKLAVLQKLGSIYADRLQNVDKDLSHAGSMRTWKRVLAIQPGHARALRVLRDSYLATGDYDGLAELYAATGDWEGLADVLSTAADKATDPALKMELSFRAADIYTERLRAPERAFRSYERVLDVAPDDRRAAAALVPLYEKEQKWGRLPALYEVLLGHDESVDDKLARLGKLVEVCGRQLGDKDAAFGYARRAYELDPERHQALATFELHAGASGQWASFVESVASRIKKVKKEDRRALRGKVAEIYATELGRVEEAVDMYRVLIEEDEGDQDTVRTLDRILRAADRRDDLRWLFDVRVGRANTAHKIDILSEWATLEEDAFNAPDHAIAIYRRILELVPQHGGALRALARLLRAAGDAPGAAEVLERDRDLRQGPERASREVELARLYLDPLARPADAYDATERALELAPNDPAATAVAELLLAVPETRPRAASLLETIYAATGAAEKQADVLEVLIVTASSPSDRMALYGRLADVRDEKLNDPAGAFGVLARAADEFPTELVLWDRLAAFATRTGHAQAFVDVIARAVPPQGDCGLPEAVELELAERAAALFDERLGDLDRARPYLERILARRPDNDRAFGRLKQILTNGEQWRELEALYERVIAVADPDRQVELLGEVALVAEEITNEKEKAIEYNERILAVQPRHEQATSALESLYASEAHWARLAKLLERRLESVSDEAALALRLRLGTLHLTRLEAPSTALDYLEVVLRDRPSNYDARKLVETVLDVASLRSRAARVLEAVYVERDEIPELVRILGVRLEFASDPATRRELLRRVAELRDERLHDDPGAFDAFSELVPSDPDDSKARGRMREIARRIGTNERAADVMLRAAEAATTPTPRADILMEVAETFEDVLHDLARAEIIFKQVLALAPTDAIIALPAARALARIYASLGKSPELCDILRVQVKLEDDVSTRREIHGRVGDLCETVLN
ncbi:MAG: hypothetical protein WCI05_08990, partial [Myxococcales bacterium]